MNLSNTLFYLTAQAEGQAASGGGLTSFLPLILIFVIFYFLLIRPQKQKQKKLRSQVEAMKIGDKVITAGGIHGLVTSVKKQSISVKVDNNVKIEFEKGSIATVISKDSSAPAPAPAPEPESKPETTDSNDGSDKTKTEESNRDAFQRDK
ncbi:MAG TPA: preprotein translocase subunit YajC [Verrucomicrobiales bacterium]|nr:preprotein translocase subunit YajC [Verrucomicrobiales bacterium]